MPLGTPLVEALEQPGPVREGGNAALRGVKVAAAAK